MIRRMTAAEQAKMLEAAAGSADAAVTTNKAGLGIVDPGFKHTAQPAAASKRRKRSDTAPVPSSREFDLGAPKKPKRATSKKPNLKRLTDEAAARSRLRNWTDPVEEWKAPTASILVGVYALCHRIVYNVEPEELTEEREFLGACSSAKRFAADAGGIETAVDAVRWSFARERDRRKRIDGYDNRLTWRRQFSKGILSDYRVSQG